MPALLQWILVIWVAATVDLLVRFRGSIGFARVLWTEAVLFPLTGLVLILLLRRNRRLTGFKRGLQVVLVWAFFLAGVRSGIWAAGFGVGAANLMVFLVALFGWLGWRVGRASTAPDRDPGDTRPNP